MDKERLTMADVYMLLAKLLSLRSTCKRAQFGCVIADKTLERIWSVGYNGAPKGFSHDTCTAEEGWCGCSHAEMNALVKVAGKDEEKVMFTTGSPCKTCANLTINSGISKLYYLEGTYRSDEGLDLIRKAGIPTEAINVPKMLGRLHPASSKVPSDVDVELPKDVEASLKLLEGQLKGEEELPNSTSVRRVRQVSGDISDIVAVKVCERAAVMNGECICSYHNLEQREANEMEQLLMDQLEQSVGERE